MTKTIIGKSNYYISHLHIIASAGHHYELHYIEPAIFSNESDSTISHNGGIYLSNYQMKAPSQYLVMVVYNYNCLVL